MLLGLSDKIIKIYGFCNVCGMEATKTYRKTEGGDRTQVGAADIYEPRCLKTLGGKIINCLICYQLTFAQHLDQPML